MKMRKGFALAAVIAAMLPRTAMSAVADPPSRVARLQ